MHWCWSPREIHAHLEHRAASDCIARAIDRIIRGAFVLEGRVCDAQARKIPNLAPIFTRLFSWATHAGAPVGAVSSPHSINDPLPIRFVRNRSRRAEEPSFVDVEDQCSTETITTYSVPVLRQCQLERTLGMTVRDCESENHSRAI